MKDRFILKLFLYAVIFVGGIHLALAGSSTLYMPLNIQKSYTNGTRSFDGKPGKSYWQNSADYRLAAQLLPRESLLTGRGTIDYHNNSPDTLNNVVIRLYQNVHKIGNPRQFPLSPEAVDEGIKIHDLKINGKDYESGEAEDSPFRRIATNRTVKLIDPLPPNKSLKIEVAWSFHIPQKFPMRMGQYSDTDFFVAYWYPQVAVYDDIDGWDKTEYLGTVEFYNDFNNYDVSLTLPGDYVVWATGELQNMKKVLQSNIIQRFKKAKTSDKVIRLITRKDYEKHQVTILNPLNVWKFRATHVTDFSFATSNHYLWDAASVEVDPKTGRRSLTCAAYPDSTNYFGEAAAIAHTTIEYLSKNLPGVPYPYSHTTSFCNGRGRGGMETPMMANDGDPKKYYSAVGLIFHEISHSYFPFYMGINERKYAWMDEGWASILPREVVEQADSSYDYFQKRVENFEKGSGQEKQVQLMMPSSSISGEFYRLASYDQPALAYWMLQDILGADMFRKALQEYIHRWNGRHPIPYDFFYTFENVSGRNLEWFWKPWFFERGYPDLAIAGITLENGRQNVTIQKIGNMPIPVHLTVTLKDDSQKEIDRPVTVWADGETEISIPLKYEKPIMKIELGSNHIPDVNKENNLYRPGEK